MRVEPSPEDRLLFLGLYRMSPHLINSDESASLLTKTGAFVYRENSVYSKAVAAPQTVRGFIVGRIPFGNTSLILRSLTREAGRVTFMARGAMRPKSPFAGTLDLFYLADFLYQPARTGEMHTLREVKLIEAHLGLRRSYPNLLAAQYFAALIETVTEAATPVEEEFGLFARALTYLCQTDISWRAVERFERRILVLEGIAQAGRDLPQAFHALHHKVPSLRNDLLRLICGAAPRRPEGPLL